MKLATMKNQDRWRLLITEHVGEQSHSNKRSARSCARCLSIRSGYILTVSDDREPRVSCLRPITRNKEAAHDDNDSSEGEHKVASTYISSATQEKSEVLAAPADRPDLIKIPARGRDLCPSRALFGRV